MVEFKVLEINLNVGTSKLMKRKVQLPDPFRPQLATLYLVKRAPDLFETICQQRLLIHVLRSILLWGGGWQHTFQFL